MSAVLDFTAWPKAFGCHYRALGLWQDKTLASVLKEASEQFADRVAIIDESHTWTYGELEKKAGELAAGFLTLGITAGDTVVVQLPNRGELFEVLFALFKIGAIPLLALPAHRRSEIRYFLEFAEAKAYVICDSVAGFDYRQLARESCEGLDRPRVIVVGDAQEFCSLASLYLAANAHCSVDADSVALMQLSGGTTGTPKLIPRTHNDYYYSVRESVRVCEWDRHTVCLTVLPACHNFALSSPGALGVFYAGGTLVLGQSAAPHIAFPLIERLGVTHCALVPPLATAWINAAATSACDLSSLQVVQVGGAKLNAEVAARFFRFFNCQLQQVFGMAEGLVCYTRLSDDREVIMQTQGKPMSAFEEVRVVDDNDRPVPVGVVGHLLTRGPYTIRGYYRAPMHNRKAFTSDGFYRTGDLVRLTERGYLVVEGRHKDQINRGGEKISAEEVENHLLAHVLVLDAAVVGIEDEYLGERICAFIVLKDPQHALNLMQARRFLQARGLADYKLPDRVEMVRSLPTTKFGKVDKNVLRELVALPLARADEG